MRHIDPDRGSPRRIVSHLARSAELGSRLGPADHVPMDGLDGLWGELLLLARVHDLEVGLNRAADALVTLDDARLSRLRGRVGPFDRELGRRVIRVLLRAEGEPGLDELSLAGLLAWASPGDGADLDALERRLDAHGAGAGH
jgi:hypothetical protein